MQPLISMQAWCSLSNEVRSRFRSVFNIPRSRSTEVNDGVIISDGTTYDDLKNLTVEKMQKYLNDELIDFHKLFDKTLAKITDELINPKVIISSETPITVIIEPVEASKKNKKNGKKN